jgi:hypothetical protein
MSLQDLMGHFPTDRRLMPGSPGIHHFFMPGQLP